MKKITRREPKTALIYRFRAECLHDVDELLERLPKNEMLQFASFYQVPFFTPTCEIAVRTLSLEAMRDCCRKVADGHVMVQTVQPKELYTGERDFTLQ